MRFLLSAIIAVFAVFYPVFSYGVTWKDYGNIGDGQTTLVNYFVGEPIEVIDENTLRIWYKWEALKFGRQLVEYLEFDCKNRKVTVLQRSEIAPEKEKKDNTDIGKAKYIEPQSIYEGFSDNYCPIAKALNQTKKK